MQESSPPLNAVLQFSPFWVDSRFYSPDLDPRHPRPSLRTWQSQGRGALEAHFFVRSCRRAQLGEQGGRVRGEREEVEGGDERVGFRVELLEI